MFNCIKSFSYKMNISANQVSNALRMKALGNTKPDTPKIAGNFFVNKFTIHLSKNHPFGGPDNQSPDFDGTVENSANGSGSDIKNEIIEISAFTDTFYDFRAVFGMSFNIRLFL